MKVRVRYHECDPMGVAHHAVFPIWLEMARTELLRENTAVSYRQLEEEGVLLAVVKLNIIYKSPARYDDELTVIAEIATIGHVKIDHRYRIMRGATVIATATTTLACIGRDGRPRELPAIIREPDASH